MASNHYTDGRRRPRTDEDRAKISAAVRRHYATHGGRAQSADTRAKIAAKTCGNRRMLGHRHTPETRRKLSEIARARGENHNFHIDGQGDARRQQRKSSMLQLEYRLWREAVFKRDNYTCQDCGARGGKLAADHIESWQYHPERRFDVSNGRTLCDPCHRKTPNYGCRAHLEAVPGE